MPTRTCILLLLLAASYTVAAKGVYAKGVYQEPEAFINEVYDGDPPSPEVVWLTRSVKETAKEILGHSPGALRVRFVLDRNVEDGKNCVALKLRHDAMVFTDDLCRCVEIVV